MTALDQVRKRTTEAALHLARAAGRRTRFSSSCRRWSCRSSPSTRPTASACGGTTSGRSTASSARCGRSSRTCPIGAYTATATEQVRHDIAAQLSLKDPAMLVGSFDRPNLIYRVRPRSNRIAQAGVRGASTATGTNRASSTASAAGTSRRWPPR